MHLKKLLPLLTTALTAQSILALDNNSLDLRIHGHNAKSAHITITNELSGATQTKKANRYGHVNFYNLDTGTYTITMNDNTSQSVEVVLGNNPYDINITADGGKLGSTSVTKGLNFRSSVVDSKENVGERELHYPYDVKQNLNSHILTTPGTVQADRDYSSNDDYSGNILPNDSLLTMMGSGVGEIQYLPNNNQFNDNNESVLDYTDIQLPFLANDQLRVVTAGAPLEFNGSMAGYAVTNLKKGHRKTQLSLTGVAEPNDFILYQPDITFTDMDGEQFKHYDLNSEFYSLGLELSTNIGEKVFFYGGYFKPWIDYTPQDSLDKTYDISNYKPNYAARIDFFPHWRNTQHHIQSFFYTNNFELNAEGIHADGTQYEGEWAHTYQTRQQLHSFGISSDSHLHPNLHLSLNYYSTTANAHSDMGDQTVSVVSDITDPTPAAEPSQFYYDVNQQNQVFSSQIDYSNNLLHTVIQLYKGKNNVTSDNRYNSEDKLAYTLSIPLDANGTYDVSATYGYFTENMSYYTSGILFDNEFDLGNTHLQYGMRWDTETGKSNIGSTTLFDFHQQPTYRFGLTQAIGDSKPSRAYFFTGNTKAPITALWGSYSGAVQSVGEKSATVAENPKLADLRSQYETSGKISVADLQAANFSITVDPNTINEAVGDGYSADTNLRPEGQNELLFGYETQMGNSWTLNTFYDLRTLTTALNYIPYEATNTETYDNGSYAFTTTSSSAIANPPLPITLDEVVDDVTTSTTYNGLALTTQSIEKNSDNTPVTDGDGNPVYNADVETTIPFPNLTRYYSGLSVVLSKPWDGDFEFIGNVTISETKGSYEGNIGATARRHPQNWASEPRTSFDEAYSYGYLPQHRLVNMKLLMTANITGSTFINVVSPRQLSCIGTHTATTPDHDNYNLSGGITTTRSFHCGNDPMKRGTATESDWVRNINLMLSYETNQLPFVQSSMVKKVNAYISVTNVTQEESITDMVELSGDTFLEPSYNHLPSRIAVGTKITL